MTLSSHLVLKNKTHEKNLILIAIGAAYVVEKVELLQNTRIFTFVDSCKFKPSAAAAASALYVCICLPVKLVVSLLFLAHSIDFLN